MIGRCWLGRTILWGDSFSPCTRYRYLYHQWYRVKKLPRVTRSFASLTKYLTHFSSLGSFLPTPLYTAVRTVYRVHVRYPGTHLTTDTQHTTLGSKYPVLLYFFSNCLPLDPPTAHSINSHNSLLMSKEDDVDGSMSNIFVGSPTADVIIPLTLSEA